MTDIVSADCSDILILTNIHRDIFSGLISTRLGKKYLSYFYSKIIDSDISVCYIARKNEKIAGFICGTENNDFLFSGIFNEIYLGVLVIIKIISQHISVRDFLDILRYKKWTKQNTIKSELLSLAVLPEYRHQGIGKNLVEKLIAYFKKDNINEFKVFSDNKTSTGIGFYKKLGFQLIDKFQHKNYETVCLKYLIQ